MRGIEELTDYTLLVNGKLSRRSKVEGVKNSLVEKDETESPLTKKVKKKVFQVTDVEQSIKIESKNEKREKKTKKVDKPAINLKCFQQVG